MRYMVIFRKRVATFVLEKLSFLSEFQPGIGEAWSFKTD
jgi:hypothetical protein